MTQTEIAPARFRLSRVVQVTFGVIRRNAILFLALAVVINAPLVLFQMVTTQLAIRGQNMTLLPARSLMLIYGGLLVYMIGALVLQAAMVHATVIDLSERRPSFGDSLTTGLREFLPLLAIGILYMLGVFLGTLLLIVPGIILLLMWSVVVPVRVVEQTGFRDSFRRSRKLTRGHRWAILGFFVILYGMIYALAFANGMITGGFADPELGGSFLSGAFIYALIFAIVITSVNSAIATVGVAVLYYELRSAKEGVVPEALASVFD